MTPYGPLFGLCLLVALGPAGALAQERAYGDLSERDRLLVQDGLAWSGDYLGTIDGRIGASTVRAARAFQRELGERTTGVLTPAEIDTLLAEADAAKEAIGYAAYADPRTGIEIGLPLGLAPAAGPGSGEQSSRFAAPDGSVEIELFRASAAGDALRQLRRAALDAPGREVTYEQAGRSWFVVTGHEEDREFYTRVHQRGDALVGFRVSYATQAAPTVEPVIIAMSSAFARPGILDVLAEPAPAPTEPEPEVAAAPPPSPAPPAEASPAREPEAAEPQIAAAPPAEGPSPYQPPIAADEPPGPDGQAEDEEDSAPGGVFAEPGEPIAGSVAVSPHGHYLTAATVAECDAPTVGSSDVAEILAVDEATGLALMQAYTLEGALVGGLADAPAAAGDVVAMATAEADLAEGEVSTVDASAEEAIGIAVEPGVEPGSPALDQYGRVVAILAAEDGGSSDPHPAVSLEAIQAFLKAQDVQPMVVDAAETPFSKGELADSARLLTEMVYCEAPAAVSGG